MESAEGGDEARKGLSRGDKTGVKEQGMPIPGSSEELERTA